VALRLRPLAEQDEEECLAAQHLLVADEFIFALGYSEGMPWSSYLERLDQIEAGQNLDSDQVPATFRVAEVEGSIVGRTSIRHNLDNDFLAREGGHIGFGVVPAKRRMGYATEILNQSLVIARGVGIEAALLTCDDKNVGSAAVIETCGGTIESVIDLPNNKRLRRYWIK
jgi:predicted acetyltransferase